MDTMRKYTDFKLGDIVVFTKVPNGSYLSTYTPYRVDNIGPREVYFVNVERGSGTSDTRSMLRTANYWVR